MVKKSTRTTIHISGALRQAIGASPDSISGRLATIGDRYSEIVRRQRIATRFSEAEMNALLDCCNGTFFQPAQLIDGAILANFEDSAADGLYEKWDIDGDETSKKLAELDYPAQVALVESIEQWWRTQCPAGPVDIEDEG